MGNPILHTSHDLSHTYTVTYTIITIIPTRTAAIIPCSLEKPFSPFQPCNMIMTNASTGKEMYQYMKINISANMKLLIWRDNCSIKIFPFYPPFLHFLA